MVSARYRPPADLTDYEGIPHQLDAWDAAMTLFFREAVARAKQALRSAPGATPQIFDALHPPYQGTLTPADIVWNGFPKTLTDQYPQSQALRLAEQLITDDINGRQVQYRPQDEYLEWHATRDPAGKLTAVDFTCEGPEYWYALAHGYPESVRPSRTAPPAHGDLDRVVALYRQYIDPSIPKADLLHNGKYNPFNKWNTQFGAMHLTHPSNALQAEVFLAGDASVLRIKDGHILEDDDDLIRCAEYGVATRSSDPTIGGAVNALARSGALVSLSNPVGLYIDSIDTAGWTKPDGSPVGNYWTVLRGTDQAIVRARYAVPVSDGFAVGDIRIGGQLIDYPGQIAERVTMRLTGVAAEQGQHHRKPVPCAPDSRALTADLVAEPSTAGELVHSRGRAGR